MESVQEVAKDELGGLGSPSDAAHDFEDTQADSEKKNHTFEISDKEVGDMEDVVLVPDKEEEKVSITVEPIQTEPAKPEESQVIAESTP